MIILEYFRPLQFKTQATLKPIIIWTAINHLSWNNTPSKLLIKIHQNQQKKRLGQKSNLFFNIWAGVDSNHRTLAGTDLQSVAFSHSATYPYSIFICEFLKVSHFFINLPLTRFELVASPLPRECATPAPQGLAACNTLPRTPRSATSPRTWHLVTSSSAESLRHKGLLLAWAYLIFNL